MDGVMNCDSTEYSTHVLANTVNHKKHELMGIGYNIQEW